MKYKAFKEKFEKLGTDSKYQGLGKEKYYALLAGKEVDIDKDVADKISNCVERVSKKREKKKEIVPDEPTTEEILSSDVDFMYDRKDRGH